jgi:hypothetical protein
MERDGFDAKLAGQEVAARTLATRLLSRLTPPRDKRPVGRPPNPVGWTGPRSKPWEDD